MKKLSDSSFIAAKADIENIKNNDLQSFKNISNPSKNNYLIFKLLYLILNPEDKIPGDDIRKELPNIRNKCLNLSADKIKQSLLSRLNDINWITPEFLDKVKMYREYPYNDLNIMDNISTACKGILGYFHNLIKYKELCDSEIKN